MRVRRRCDRHGRSSPPKRVRFESAPLVCAGFSSFLRYPRTGQSRFSRQLASACLPMHKPIAPRPIPTRHEQRSAESSSSARRKMRLPMRALHPLPAFKRSLSWLLWLALLLPLAHSAAIWHGYSHSAADAAGYAGDKGVPFAAKCDLCLAAASVSGGALPADPPRLSTAAARDEMPPAQVRSSWLAPPALAYLSRAPPLAPR